MAKRKQPTKRTVPQWHGTTVAFDGRYIASDTMVSLMNNFKVDAYRKLLPVRINHDTGIVYSICGAAAFFEPFIEWHLRGGDVDEHRKLFEPDNDDYGFTGIALIVRDQAPKMEKPKKKGGKAKLIAQPPKISIEEYNSALSFRLMLQPPIAMGSGMDAALAIMTAGGSADQAVTMAAKIDSGTGGTIEVFDTWEWKWVRECPTVANRETLEYAARYARIDHPCIRGYHEAT
jgi:hypothetical protein